MTIVWGFLLLPNMGAASKTRTDAIPAKRFISSPQFASRIFSTARACQLLNSPGPELKLKISGKYEGIGRLSIKCSLIALRNKNSQHLSLSLGGLCPRWYSLTAQVNWELAMKTDSRMIEV